MFAEINAVITGLSGAAAITKGLVYAESALEKADLKFKLSELMQHIAEAQSQMADIKISTIHKDEEIRNLTEKLKIKDNIVRENGVYYRSNDNGEAIGEAICSKCWDVHNLLVHIVQPTPVLDLECPNCKQKYDGGRVHRVIK